LTADALFRVRLSDGSFRLAVGVPDEGPERVLAADVSLDRLLGDRADLNEAVAGATDESVPSDAMVVAPVESQEVWGAGVTYLRSREARVEEAANPTPYELLYDAERPEVYFKTSGWRAVGSGEPIGIRRDSTWDVPEPELTLVLDAGMRIAGYTIGNDVSSRSIEGENTLYLPQAKTFEGSCAVGPCIVPAGAVSEPFEISMEIERAGGVVFAGETSTAEMRRSFDELARYLGRALAFPVGAFLLTGTGIIPEATFTLAAGDVVRISVDGLGTLENAAVDVG
jgi:2-dehydro-3-deoxy-D-arabinonate dehydratase